MKNSVVTGKNTFRILQVSDPQDLKYVRPAMTEMLDKAYDTLKPDLVVFTGDNILGNHLLDARFGSRQVAEGKQATIISMKVALSHILKPVNMRGIPFAMVYGNHDDMNPVTKDEQMDIYRSYHYCMQGNTADKSVDCDTYVVKIYKGNELVYALYMVDSAWQDEKGKCYTQIKPETVQWFIETNAELKDVPAIVFTHIPLKQQKMLTEKCTPYDRGAVTDGHGNTYRLDKTKALGYMGETISALDDDCGLFDELVKAGNIKAIVTGHDHRNCFTGTYKGITFIQSGAASFRCYGTTNTRGVRVIDINTDGTFETKFYSFYDLCGKTFSSKVKFFMNADEHEKHKLGVILGTAGACLAGIAISAFKLKVKR